MLTPDSFLKELHARGATRIRRVHFRANRSTVWSLTQKGTSLNLHVAYRGCSEDILDSFAFIAREGGLGSAGAKRAADRVAEWPGVREAMRRLRLEHARSGSDPTRPTACCATPGQRAYLRTVYSYFNVTRFDGVLPDDVPLRLSRRMRSALGHMLPGSNEDGTRRIVEIALNCDLMLPGNGAERADTLLHEMAHAADYLESGGLSHGRSWKAWAERVGCRPTRLYDRPVRYRRRRLDVIERVPPLPPGLTI